MNDFWLPLRAIRNDKEHKKAVKTAYELDRKKRLTCFEKRVLSTLLDLIDQYESKYHRIAE